MNTFDFVKLLDIIIGIITKVVVAITNIKASSCDTIARLSNY